MPAEPKKKRASALSMRNTKQQLLDAYQQALRTIQEQEKQRLQPDSARKQRQTRGALKSVANISPDGIIQQTTRLKQEVNKILLNLTDRLTAEIDRLDHLHLAVEIKERELKELYDIEHEAATLASLIEAHQQQKEVLERDMVKTKDRLSAEVEAQRAKWKKEKQEYEAKQRERRERESKKRKRQEEEYEYTTAQQRQRAQEQFETQRARLAQEMQTLREQTERDIVQKGLELAQREEEFTALQAQVADFPQRLASAVEQAVQENTQQLEQDAQHQMELQQKEYEGQRHILQTRIQALEKTVKQQRDHINKLTKQQDTAYQTIQKLTLKAIEGAGKAGAFNDLEQFLKEQFPRQAKEE